MSVNLSAPSLLDPTIPGPIADLLRGHRIRRSNWSWRWPSRWRSATQEVIDEVLAQAARVRRPLWSTTGATAAASLKLETRVQVDELKVDR